MARHLIPVDAIVVYVMHTHILVVLLWIFFSHKHSFLCVHVRLCARNACSDRASGLADEPDMYLVKSLLARLSDEASNL